MARTNMLLTLILIVCALGVVTSQHRARKLFVELEKEQEQTAQLTVEWGQLQLEQSTWAMPARIEQIATGRLRMRVPDATRIQVISPVRASDPVAVAPGEGGAP